MKHSQKIFLVFIFSISLLSLTGCGTQTAKHENQQGVGQKIVDSNVQVIEITSAVSLYDGKEKTIGSGPDSVTTTLGIDKNNLITSVKNSYVAGPPKSKMYQDKFEGAIAAQVIGKNIKDAKIGVIAGASATSAAFNAALDDIRTKKTNG